MRVSPQPGSALLLLPSEIRNQIWQLVFLDHHVILSRSGPQLAQDDCRACIDLACSAVATGISTSDYPSWIEVVRPLRACKQIFNEAKDILFSSFTLHLGSPSGETMFPSVPAPLASLKHHVRRLELRVHMEDENRVDWPSSVPSIGDIFPNLETVMIHAHMRPPSSYEVLLDGVYLAFPVVRLEKRTSPNIQLSFDMAYTFSGVMFESPFLGSISTEDALDEHELVIRDLMADEEFIELAIASENEVDIQAMTTILVRCARAHEQAWFDKLRRNQERRQRELATQQSESEAGQSEQAGQI